MKNTVKFPEFGAYALPGHIFDPKQIYDEIEGAEEVGLGSIWISERFSAKNGDVLSGAAACKTDSLGICAGLIQNLPLRHPIVTGGFSATMAKLADNRFALGIGRGTDIFADVSGTPRVTMQIMEDSIKVLRKLWRGEVVDYQGPLGNFHKLSLGLTLETPPPVIVAGMGDKTLKWAGSIADGVVFNSLWSTEAVAHSVKMVRQGAEEAGRDPASVRIWTILVTACDTTEENYLNWVIRRMNTYLLFPPMFEKMCEVNGWDKQKAVELRQSLKEFDKAPASGTMGDEATTRDIDNLRKIEQLYPRHWITDANAVGSAEVCAKALAERFEAGADSVLFHGTHPRALKSLMEIWPKYRPDFKRELAVNPGLWGSS